MKKKNFISSKDKKDWVAFTKQMGNIKVKESDLLKNTIILILSDHGIKHMIADEFLSITDLWNIWKKSFSLSQWYNNSEIAEILEYKGINTGKLFYIEFHYHLLPFLKKFMAIIFLCKKFHSSRILAPSSLSDIFDLLDHDVEYIKVKQKSESFLYDSVKFQITDSLSIKIPKKSYLKLKNISDNFF